MSKNKYNLLLVTCLIYLSLFGASCERESKELSDKMQESAGESMSTVDKEILGLMHEKIDRIGELAGAIEQLRSIVLQFEEGHVVPSGGAREILDDLLWELEKRQAEMEKERASLQRIIDSSSIRE